MGGLAFLPWEKWIARAFHTFAAGLKRWSFKMRRQRNLARSKGWPEIRGIVESVNWDSSMPREEVCYSFQTERGDYNGYDWVWFESPNDPQFHVGDAILIRYAQDDPAKSVLLRLK